MPAIRRTIKKFVYAASVISAFLTIASLIVIPRLSFLRKEPVPVAEVRKSILVESLDVVEHDGSIDIIARVRNPNPRHGVPQYTVVFTLLDKNDNAIQNIPTQTYLLPGSLNYITTLNIPINKDYTGVKASAPNEPAFARTPQTVTTPTFNSFLRSRVQRQIGNRVYEIQKGIVLNTGSLGFRKVDITGVALDSQGQVVGASKTFIGEFKSGEQREFTLQWPLPANSTERVIVLPSANIYLPENILTIKGNPNELR